MQKSQGKLSKSARRRRAKSKKDFSASIEGLNAGMFSVGKASLSYKPSRNLNSPMAGLAEFARKVQVMMPRISSEGNPRYGTMDVLKGTEYLTPLNNTDAGYNAGDLITTLYINPAAFANTRLAQFATLYERFRFRSISFIYEPIASATESGQLIGYGDYDPGNVLTTNSEDNIQVAAAHLGNEVTQIWQRQVFPFGIVDNYTTLFIVPESDPRLSYQGVYYLLAASDLDHTSVSALGNLYIEYEIELIIPILSTTVLNSSVSFFGLSATGDFSNLLSGLVATSAPTGLPSNSFPLENLLISSVSGSTQVEFVGLPVGNYRLSISFLASASTISTVGLSITLNTDAVFNCAVSSLAANYSTTVSASNLVNGSLSVICQGNVGFKVTGDNPVLQFVVTPFSVTGTPWTVNLSAPIVFSFSSLSPTLPGSGLGTSSLEIKLKRAKRRYDRFKREEAKAVSAEYRNIDCQLGSRISRERDVRDACGDDRQCRSSRGHDTGLW